MTNSGAVAGVLIPALSAVLGAILGTYLALFQKTRESAFERRLAWYEAMFKALMTSRARVIDEFRRLEYGSEDTELLLLAITQALEEVREIRLTAALYASEDLLKKLDEVFDQSQDVFRRAVDKGALSKREYIALAKRFTNFELRSARLLQTRYVGT